jgi:D-alanyl-D-alanine carboxypeptidase
VSVDVGVPAAVWNCAAVMNGVSSIGGIGARIAALSTRFEPAGFDATGGMVDQFTAPSTNGSFDPFGEVYQAALAARPSFSSNQSVQSAQSAGTGIGRIGGFGPISVPESLRQYGNGRLPLDALTPIGQGGHRLYAPAAAKWQELVAAAAADGVSMSVTDSYRSFDDQVDLARRKGLYKDGGLAAVPGTSNHGWGMAVDADVTDPAALAWMRANAPRFGFVEAVPREPWHWEFRPAQV